MLLPRIRTVYQLHRFCSTASTLKEQLTTNRLNFTEIKHKPKVPLQPCVIPSSHEPEKFEIDKKSLELLEKFALVNIRDK